MYTNLCVYSGDSKMLLSAQAQRLINIHLSKFIQHRLTQPAAALHLETKLVKLAFVNVRSYMWTLFFCVHSTYHINVYFYTTTNKQLCKADTT